MIPFIDPTHLPVFKWKRGPPPRLKRILRMTRTEKTKLVEKKAEEEPTGRREQVLRDMIEDTSRSRDINK